MKTLTAIAVLLAALPAYAAPTGKVLTESDITYVGSFLLPLDSTSCASDGYYAADRGIAFRPATTGHPNGTLFVTGPAFSDCVGEVEIPDLSAIQATVAITNPALTYTLPRASSVQPLASVTNSNLNKLLTGGGAAGGSLLGGLHYYGGKLYGTSYIDYDGSGAATRSHFTHSTTLSDTSSYAGMYTVAGVKAGEVAGYFGDIPAEWQSYLGGKTIIGTAGISIITRTAYGPEAVVIDPANITGTASESNPIPATPLVQYTASHPLGPGDGYSGQSSVFNGSSRVSGVVFPANSNSVLFFGDHGSGPFSYKCDQIACADPGNVSWDAQRPSSWDVHAPPYRYQIWHYNAADLLAVKNGTLQPWQLTPQVWRIKNPASTLAGDGTISVPLTNWRYFLDGAAYDPTTQRVYLKQRVAERGADDSSTFRPVISVLQLNVTAGTYTGTPPTHGINLRANRFKASTKP